MTDPVPAAASIPAATVVVFRNDPAGGAPQILMVTRSREMRFAGGMAVFPGGRVDPADFALARSLSSVGAEDETAHRIAAVRETLEETGLVIGTAAAVSAGEAAAARALLLHTGALAPVLERFGWALDLARIEPFARWNPRGENLTRVFDTRFYLADLGTGDVALEIDATENTRLFWITAAGALAAAERGELAIIFPTRRNLERLARFASFAEACADARAHPVRTITPWIEQRGAERWLAIPADAGYPVDGEPLRSAHRQ